VLWDKKEQSVKIGIKKGVNGETITITDPSEVREYVWEVWASHFEARTVHVSTKAHEWIKLSDHIQGETDNLLRHIKIEELQETIKSISNNKAPGPTEKND
jgi:hypothetical protein